MLGLIYDLSDEFHNGDAETMKRYDKNGESFCERVNKLFQMSNISQWDVWDTCFDCGPATVVGSTSIAWVEDGVLHLEVYDWEE